MACLDEEQLRRLAKNSLSPEEAAPLLAHCETCPTCRSSVEEWRENLSFMAVLKRGGQSKRALRGSGDQKRVCPPDHELDGYEILQGLHCGSQGVVYRAVRRGTDTEVAIKFLREGNYASEASRRRFEREVELVQTLQHPNIIRIIDSGTTKGGDSYYITDYVPGLPLHRFVRERRLTVEKTLQLFVRVCEAVNYAHQCGVIHRDLKPSNVLVDGSGQPWVLDFGLARWVEHRKNTFLSMTGQVMGTLPYMSPEQTSGERYRVDIRTDVYSLGVMLFQVLTGRFPYPVTGSVPRVIRHINETSPLSPSSAWTEEQGVASTAPSSSRDGTKQCPFNDDLDTIVFKALAKDPDRRYANVALLIADIRRYLAGQPIEARREAWVYALSRRLRRYKVAAALACVCVVLVAALGVNAWWMYRIQREERLASLAMQSRLAAALLKLGDNALGQGDLEDASGQYRAGLAIAEHLSAGDLGNLRFQLFRADGHVGLCRVALGRKEEGLARQQRDRALSLLRQLVAADPGNPDFYPRLEAAERLLSSSAPATRPSDTSSDDPFNPDAAKGGRP